MTTSLQAKTNNRELISPPDKVALVAFLYSAAVTAAIMAMPFLVFKQLGQGAVLSGIYAGAAALGYTVAALASSGYVGRSKNGMTWGTIGVLGYMALMCAIPFFRNLWVCGALFTGASTVSALAWPAFHSWVGAEHNLAVRSRYMGRLNVGWSTGGAAGPLLAGPLYEMDYRLPFVFVGALCLVTLYFIRRVPHESSYFGTGSREVLLSRVAHDRASEAYLWCAWAATFTAHITIGAVRSIFPKRLDDIIASGQLRIFNEADAASWLNAAAATRFSWLVVVMGLGTAVLFFFLGRSGWWHHRFSVLVAAQLLTGFSMWILGHTHSFALMLAAFAVIGANLGVAFFSSVYYSMADASRKHGRAAINEGVVGAGGIVGSFGFAFMGAHLGLEAPFLWMPAFISGIIVLQLLLIRLRRQRGPAAPGA